MFRSLKYAEKTLAKQLKNLDKKTVKSVIYIIGLRICFDNSLV